MKLKKYQPILEVIVIALLAYLLHTLFFYLNNDNPKFQNFHTSAFWLSGFCSGSVFFARFYSMLLKVSKRPCTDISGKKRNR